MQHAADSDARKRRDALVRSQDEEIAEHLAGALKSGELQSAPSYGRPLADAEGWAQTPTEFRLPFKILKNAGVPPPELELFHKRASVRHQLAVTSSEEERKRLLGKLSELEQIIALRLEGMRSSGKL